MSWPLRIIHYSFYGLFLLVPLIFLPWTSELFEFNKLLTTYIFTIIIVCAWIIRCIASGKFIFNRTPLDLPLLLFLISQLVSLAFSLDPRTSFFGYYGRWNGGLVSLLSYALLYWAFVSNLDAKAARSTFLLSLLSAAYISLYGILEHFGVSLSCLTITGEAGVKCWVQDVQNRVFATLGQPNWLAAYLSGLLFLPLAAFLNNTRPKLHLLVFALMFACLLFTKSRSGIFAFGLAYAIFVGVAFLHQRLNSSLIIISAVLLIGVMAVKNPVQDLLFSFLGLNTSVSTSTGPALETGGTESGAIRQIVWTGAIRAWQSSTKTLFLGSGPETFAMAYFKYRPIEHNTTSEWELLYNKAHNEYLNFLTTTGLVGLGAYLLLLGVMTVVLISALRRSDSPLFPLALLCGWLTLLITNFPGFSVVVTQLLLFLLPAAAYTLSTDHIHETHPSPSTPRLVAIGGICLVGLYLFVSVARIWLADYHYSSAQKAETAFSSSQDSQYLLDGFEHINAAYDISPNEPNYNLELSSLAGYLGLLATDLDATAASQLLTLADQASQRAIQLSPNHPSHYKSRARTLIIMSALNSKYLAEAAQSIRTAQSLSPTDPRLPFNLGIIANYQHATPEAKLYFEASLKLKPDFGEALLQLQEQSSSPSASP